MFLTAKILSRVVIAPFYVLFTWNMKRLGKNVHFLFGCMYATFLLDASGVVCIFFFFCLFVVPYRAFPCIIGVFIEARS